MATNQKFHRVPTRIHTRELDRAIARKNMKKQKLTDVMKHSYSHGFTLSGKEGEITRNGSWFSEHWREYAGV